MQLIRGYPDKIIFKTQLNNTITVSCGKDCVNVVYLKKTGKDERRIVEGKHETITMIK